MASNPRPRQHDFIPSRENELLAWSRQFDGQINATPANFGLTPAQASAYTALHDAFAAGYANATNPTANSKANIIAKNQAKAALKAYARMLARLVRATPEVTNAQRGQLGLTVPDPDLTPVPVPAEPPLLIVMSTSGRVVRVRLRDKFAPTRRGKPPGIAGAAILSYTGETTSARMSDWTYHGNATRTQFDVNIPSNVRPGSKVWFVAQWYNTRGERGPASTAKATYIGDGVSNPSGRALAA
jgi:hypothetical protein